MTGYITALQSDIKQAWSPWGWDSKVHQCLQPKLRERERAKQKNAVSCDGCLIALAFPVPAHADGMKLSATYWILSQNGADTGRTKCCGSVENLFLSSPGREGLPIVKPIYAASRSESPQPFDAEVEGNDEDDLVLLGTRRCVFTTPFCKSTGKRDEPQPSGISEAPSRPCSSLRGPSQILSNNLNCAHSGRCRVYPKHPGHATPLPAMHRFR